MDQNEILQKQLQKARGEIVFQLQRFIDSMDGVTMPSEAENALSELNATMQGLELHHPDAQPSDQHLPD